MWDPTARLCGMHIIVQHASESWGAPGSPSGATTLSILVKLGVDTYSMLLVGIAKVKHLASLSITDR